MTVAWRTVNEMENSGEKVLDSGYILKGVLLDFADNLDGCMGGGGGGGKRRVKDDAKIFGLSTWKNGFSLSKMGKTVCVGAGVKLEKTKNLILDTVSSRYPLDKGRCWLGLWV